MSDIDLIDKGSFDEEIESIEEDSALDDMEEKSGKRRTTRQQLKVRRAIEDHLEKKRFRHEIDYFSDFEFEDDKK